MSHLTDIWRELVRRRLWPVALLLVAAIAAVPLVLAKEPEPTVEAAPPAPAGGGDSDLSEDPIVTAEAVSVRSKGRVVIGRQRDIFASTAKQPKPEKQPDKEAKQSGGGKQDAPKHDAPTPTPAPSGGGGGGASGPSAPAPAPQSAPAPKPKPKTYPLYSLKVRFSGDGEGVKGVLARRTALPSDAEPLIIYLGLLDDHKTAEFLVDSTVTAVGDGACHPYPQSCETVRMRKGDTMFFDVHDETGAVGSQFELDLLDVNKKQTTNAARAARSSKRVSLARAASVTRRGSGLGATSLLPIR